MGLSQTDMIEHTSMGFLLRGEFLLYKLANYATVNLTYKKHLNESNSQMS